MTQNLKSNAYILNLDLDRFETLDWEYDLELDTSQIEQIRNGEITGVAPLNFPNPLKYWAEMSSLQYTDYPYCDYLSGSIMSKRMLEVLLSVKNFAYRTYPVEITDWEMMPPREFQVENNYDYVAVQLTEFADVFDWEKSAYTANPRTNFLSSVDEFVFKTPHSGLPPIFRLERERATLFVSEEARQALKNAGVKGIKYTSLKGFGSEIDVPLNHPIDMNERETVLRRRLGV